MEEKTVQREKMKGIKHPEPMTRLAAGVAKDKEMAGSVR